jgi:A/G-specific adenine glycosylase
MNRRDLPWRGASPYAVWVSEIMLQQTQVATAIPFYRRFLERFPTVETLASAPIDEVLRYWAGMGYYARARNLHRAAQAIVDRFGGCIPDTLDAIRSLPGIGRYTAGAILSIAYNLPHPLVDANVTRVLSRLFGLRGNPRLAASQAALWSLAERLLPPDAAGDFNQALMDLGALLCSSADPGCERCPLLKDCVAGNSPDPSSLPEYPAGRAAITVTHSAAVIRDAAGRALIVRRPAHGMWGGLWEFPRVACVRGEPPEMGAIRAAKEIAGLDIVLDGRVARIRHTVTHHRITLYGFSARMLDPDARPSPHECADARWAPLDALADYAFSSPQALLREALVRQRPGPRSQTGQATQLILDLGNHAR